MRFLYEKPYSGRPLFFAGRLLNLLKGAKASKLRFLKIYFVEVKLGFLKRTRILNGIQFTIYFIEFVLVETNQLVRSIPNVI